MGLITNKYQSYDHHKGISFDEATFTSDPTKTGTRTTNGNQRTMVSGTNDGTQNPNIIIGPLYDQNAYKFSYDTTVTPNKTSRLIYGSTNTTDAGSGTDIRRVIWSVNEFQDIVIGFWLKTPSSFPVDNASFGLHRWLYGSAAIVNIGPGKSGGNPSIGFIHGSEFSPSIVNQYTSYTDSNSNTINIQWNKWYFVAIRKITNVTNNVASNGDPAQGTIEYQHYINGELVNTITRSSWTIRSCNGISFGSTSGIGTSQFDVGVANWFVTDWSVVGQTGLREIYNSSLVTLVTSEPMTASALSVDSSISVNSNVNYNDTGTTASALIMHPTITVTSNDSTNTTTSFEISAEFLSNITILTGEYVNIVLTETLNASIQLINNVDVSTGSDISYSALEFTASAIMENAVVAQAPFIVSATMPNPNIYVTPSYFKLIKDLNPYLYINNGKGSTEIINYGYQNGTFVRGSDLSANVDGGLPLNLIAEGKSWEGTSGYGNNSYITFETTNYANSFNNLIGSGNFAYEVWYKPKMFPQAGPNTGFTPNDSSFSILNSENLQITMEDFYREIINDQFGNTVSVTNYPRYLSVIIKNSPSTTIEKTYPLDNSTMSVNNWNHVVLNVYQSGINSNERLIQLWINGQITINENISFTTWTNNSDKINYVLGSNATALEKLADAYFDELAIYSSPLTNSQITQHNNFITTISPDFYFVADLFIANAESGNHQFTITSNANAIAIPITGSALFVNPLITTSTNIINIATVLQATTIIVDPTIYYGRTIFADPATAYAEKAESFFLNSYYYQYIQNNFAPYRYVTFDSSEPYLDYGSDIDYSVANVIVNGTVVNPNFGINGKSVKSTGSYTNGAAILKESEHDDNWGTGNNSWHSSFWVQRALDDNSTGLRVLWNLNGYSDNQNIIIYHYQNKLHVQINNQNGAPITISTANNINIFDFERHHIVLNYHHNNNQNTLTLYVDGVQVATQNIGNYAVTTINDASHIGPNDEVNNFPRLGIGTLITPFAFTSLPVVPSNISVYFDEIYWDKNQITLTEVINQFNAMPTKTNKTIIIEPFITNTTMPMPSIITNSIIFISPMLMNTQMITPTIYVVKLITIFADVMNANATIENAIGFVPININSDIMIASAVFNSTGAFISIPGETMYATIAQLKDPSLINGNPINKLSAYIRYVRIESKTNASIPMMKEIK